VRPASAQLLSAEIPKTEENTDADEAAASPTVVPGAARSIQKTEAAATFEFSSAEEAE
jgi:hypothetical protein